MNFRLVYMSIIVPLLSYTNTPSTLSFVFNNSSKSINNNTQHQTVSSDTAVQQHAPVVTPYPPASFTSAVATKQPSAFLKSWKDELCSNPYIATGSIIVGCYILVFSNLYSLIYLCTNHCPWAHWHENISLKQLQKIPVPEKGAALMSCITRVYDDKKADSSLLLLYFMNDLRIELSWHHSFLRLYTWLQKIHLSFLFPSARSHAQKIADQKERLIELCTIIDSLCSLQSVNCYDTQAAA